MIGTACTTTPSQHTDRLRSISARATFLPERIGGSGALDEGIGSVPRARTRAAHWAKVVSPHDQNGLAKRLQWDGLSVAGVMPALAAPPPEPSNRIPDWALVLDDIAAAAIRAAQSPFDHPLLDVTRPLPFEHVLIPVAQVAGRQLACRDGGGGVGVVPIGVNRRLLRSLLGRLSEITTEVLYAEFVHFRETTASSNGKSPGAATDDDSYRAFVRRLLAAGMWPLFEAYPVLARLIVTVLRQWVDATVEFLSRLHRDLETICVRFSPAATRTGAGVSRDRDTTAILDIEPDLSDRHRNGRTVMSVTLSGGTRVVYKPKPLRLEIAFSDLLRRCNAWLPERDQMMTPAILDRDTYGWVQYVEHRPCPDAAAVQRFFGRAGILLGIVHVLRATDCHNENLIAHGEHPVLIDAETLLHPNARSIDGLSRDASGAAATERFSDSVLRTGLLPRWTFSADNRRFSDVSGLGAAQSSPKAEMWTWVEVNTARMAPQREQIAIPETGNTAVVDGVPQSAERYRQEILNGFRTILEVLRQHRDELLAALMAFSHAPVRFIFRPTRVYAAVLRRAVQPSCLRDGVDFSITIDHLARPFLADDERPATWPLLQSEIRAMERLDIPFFNAFASGTAIVLEDGTEVPDYFRKPGISDAIDRLSGIAPVEVDWQAAIIEGALFASGAAPRADGVGIEYRPLPEPPASDLAARAIVLSEAIAARAVADEDGGLHWVGLRHVLEADRVQLQVVGDGLYDGRCGIALLFAAGFAVSGDDRYRNLALATLLPLRRQLQSWDHASLCRYARFAGVGGASGVGSIAYAFAAVHRHVNEPELLGEACRLTDCMTSDRISSDTTFDVIGGSAGALLGLLALHDVAPTQRLRHTAMACGDHLLRHRHGKPGRRAWLTLDADQPLTGFSHGAAGIAYALLRLFAVCGDLTYRDAALEAIEYERHAYSTADGNWPDFRRLPGAPAPTFATQWCHGAAGIALGRLGALDIVDDQGIRDDIERGLSATVRHPFDDIDHICCGNLGRIETLAVAAERLGRAEWRRAALLRVANVLARADCGGLCLSPHLPASVFDPGLFRGAAGVAYALLRLARPQLPSVLLWA
jgi:type 2 lantibiotic biosynthesis protein LanM